MPRSFLKTNISSIAKIKIVAEEGVPKNIQKGK